MRFGKLLTAVGLAVTLSAQCITASAYDFWIDNIGPEKTSTTESRSEETVANDIEKVRQIAMKYSDIYVVEQKDYIDIEAIDDYMDKCSSSITLEELDNGKQGLNFGDIFDSQTHKEFTYKFRNYAGPCNLNVYFEPIVYFQIYRNIYVVGGYYDYSECNLDVDLGLWNAVNYIQGMTKEIVQWDTKMQMRQQINDLYWDISQDKGLKVFILTSEGNGNSNSNGASDTEPQKKVQSVFRIN